MSESVVVRRVYPKSVAAVWKAITTPSLLARWLHPNTFEPTVGHRFEFRPAGAPPIRCTVLQITPGYFVKMSWLEGGTRSELTLSVSPHTDGTELCVKHVPLDGKLSSIAPVGLWAARLDSLGGLIPAFTGGLMGLGGGLTLTGLLLALFVGWITWALPVSSSGSAPLQAAAARVPDANAGPDWWVARQQDERRDASRKAVGVEATIERVTGSRWPMPADEGALRAPVWSRDGKFLSVERSIGERTAIDLYEVKGSQLTLTHTINDAAELAWHPMGIMVFAAPNPNDVYDGYRRLRYAQPGGAASAEMIRSKTLAGELTLPSISPDGGSMVFLADSQEGRSVRARNTTSGKLKTLATNVDSRAAHIWGKDLASLAFVRDGKLTIVPASGEEVVVSQAHTVDSELAPSLQGVAFLSGDDLVRWNGSSLELVLAEVDPTSAPPAVWGNDLAVTQNGAVVVVAGQQVTQLPTGPTPARDPSLHCQSGWCRVAYVAAHASGDKLQVYRWKHP